MATTRPFFPFLLLAFHIFSSFRSCYGFITPSAVQELFTSAKLIPDVVDKFEPTTVLNLVFSDEENRGLILVPGELLSVSRKAYTHTHGVTL
jgi:hypothetical protein